MSQNRSPAAAAWAKHESKDYQYIVGWSKEDQAYIGTVAEFPSLAAHGDSFEDALKETLTVVTDVLVDLRDSGERVPEPFGNGSTAVLLTCACQRIFIESWRSKLRAKRSH